jgi:phage-related protein
MTKIITWVMVNGATLLGVLQAIVKAIKELLTGIVNLLSLFMTADAAEASVKTVRAAMNWVDDILEKIKSYLVR